MAVSKYEQVKEVTAPIEATFYKLLDHLDEYRDLLARLIAQEESEAEPNAALIKRFRQFTSRADTMVKHLDGAMKSISGHEIERLRTRTAAHSAAQQHAAACPNAA